MKKIISFLLCVAMVMSSTDVVLAEESTEIVYNTVSVEFSDNIGNLETLQVMAKDDNVYANAEELGLRLGYDVSVSDEYVSIYNQDADDNVPYGLTAFYYDSTKVGHMLFTQMVDSYEAPFETIKNENGVWIPLEYSLLLLNSSMLIVDNTILIDMPRKNIIDIYTDILKNNQRYLFDWQNDIGLSEKNEDTMGKASFVVTMFSGLLGRDGDSWVQFVQNFALDSSAYDSKYGEELAMLFCTYSDDELEQEVKEMKKLMSHFNGKGALGKTINAIDKELDNNIGELLKTSNELKAQIDVNNNASIAAYNKSYQALENACDRAGFFSEATELYTRVGKGVSEATSFLDKFYKVAEVVGFASEFQNQDKFAVNVLSEFVKNPSSQSVMSNAMKDGIGNYTNTLQTDIATYSALRYLKENYDNLIFEAADLVSSLGLSAQLMLIAWDVVSETVPFYKEGISNADSFMLSMYASIFQADAFTSYQKLRNLTFEDVNNITPKNLYEVSQYCYTYLKSSYITRNAALAALGEETRAEIPYLIEEQNSVNKEISGYLVQLKNADTTNEKLCYGFLPKDSEEYLVKYDDSSLVELCSRGQENEIPEAYRRVIEQYIFAFQQSWDSLFSMKASDWYENNGNLSEVGYALLDIDGNGVEELLIGEPKLSVEDPSLRGFILDAYTIENGEAIHVFSSWAGGILYCLCENGKLVGEGSGDAYASVVSYYQLVGSTVERVGNIKCDINVPAEQQPVYLYSTDGKEYRSITQEEMDAIENSYVQTDIAYIPFLDYLTDEADSEPNSEPEVKMQEMLLAEIGLAAIDYYYDVFEPNGTPGIIAVYQYGSEWMENDNCQVWYCDGTSVKQLFLWENTSGNAFCNVTGVQLYRNAKGRPYVILETWQRVASSFSNCMIFGADASGEINQIHEVTGSVTIANGKLFVAEEIAELTEEGLTESSTEEYQIEIVDGAVHRI